MNEPLLTPDMELLSLRKRADYMEWLLARYRQYAREQLNVSEHEFTLWLAHKTAIEGIPDTDTQQLNL